MGTVALARPPDPISRVTESSMLIRFHATAHAPGRGVVEDLVVAVHALIEYSLDEAMLRAHSQA